MFGPAWPRLTLPMTGMSRSPRTSSTTSRRVCGYSVHDLNGLDRADEQAGDPVEDAALAQDLEVVPDVDRRGVEVLEEQDRAVEPLGRERPRRRLDPQEAVQQPAEQSALGAARAPGLPGRQRRQRADRLGRRQDAAVGVGLPGVVGIGQLVPLADAEQQRVGVEGDEPGPRVDRQAAAR